MTERDFSNWHKRYLEEYSRRVPPGSVHGRGATWQSIMLGEEIEDRMGDVPVEIIALMADVDPLWLKLLVKGVLDDSEIGREEMQRLAGTFDQPIEEIITDETRPVSWK